MSDGMLAGFAPPKGPTPVHDAYERACDKLREDGIVTVIHEGIVQNLLRLGTIIDAERKGYAVAHASAQAHDLMKTLLDLVPPETGDEFTELLRELDRVNPSKQ